MNYLLAASLPLLIFAFGTATSIGTTKALQDWAVARLDVRTSTGDLLVAAPKPAPYPLVDGLLE
jgi:hypothetical protein